MSLIDDYLQKLEIDKKIREPGVYFVTELVKECQLNAYCNIKEEIPSTKKMLRIFNSGNILEEFWVQDVLCHTPGIQVVATQLPARYTCPEFSIHGRVDALCVENDRLVIHECKTAKSCSWMREAKWDHYLQLNFYLCALGVEFGVVDYIDKSILLLGEDQKNPDFPPDTHYQITKNMFHFNDMIATAKALHQCVTTDTPPPPTPCWMCDRQNYKQETYCDYIDKCPAHAPPPPTSIQGAAELLGGAVPRDDKLG